METENNRVVDLFCGCSGLGLGARQAGFEVVLSVDNDSILTSSHRVNFPGEKLHLGDIARLTGYELRALAGGAIDGIVGGPPCQGFSSIGKSDPNDNRRSLLKHFFRLVSEVQPRFFIMENVKGLLNKGNIDELHYALDLIRTEYSVLGPCVLNAKDFGAATSRPRVFVIGFKYSDADALDHFIKSRMDLPATVKDAIEDLIDAEPISIGEDSLDYWRVKDAGTLSIYAESMRTPDRITTGLKVVEHKTEIARRYAAVPAGTIDKVGRHFKLSWDGQCPTLRAGTGPDRGSFQSVRPLHPFLPRVINVREAARLQGFPDWFRFHATTWHSFRMIGNSVSPIISRQIFLSLIDAGICLRSSTAHHKRHVSDFY